MTDAPAASPPGFPQVAAAGESALLVRFGDRYTPANNRAALAFDAALRAGPPAWIVETVPTICSVLIAFDPSAIAPEALEDRCLALLDACDWYAAPAPADRRRWSWPVIYGGADGPALAAVADRMGLREDQVIAAHCAQPLPVLMLGFAPGLAYLGGLGAEWDLPRRKDLVAEVPAGAVMVAIRQTVLPATPIPTGWWQIGRSPVLGFDPGAAEPFRLAPGDEVVFEPVRPGARAMARKTPL